MLHSPEFYKKKNKVRNVKIAIGIFVLLLIVVLPVIILRLERFQIRNVEASGNTVTPDGEITRVVEESLSGNYLWLIPKRTTFIYPKDDVARMLQSEIPRLVEVKLDRTDMKSLSVVVKERAPYALYCEQLEDTDGSGCYFLDEEGLVFSKAPYFSGDVYFIYTLSESLTDPLGKMLLDEAQFAGIREFVEGLQKSGVDSRYVVVGDKYNLILRDGGKVIWKREDDPKVILKNLTAFLKTPAIVAEEDFLSRVSYVDLSIPNKVIYKFRSE